MLPYVFDEVSREGWLSIAPTKGKVMSGVFHLLKEYNAKLSSIQFSGVSANLYGVQQCMSTRLQSTTRR